ncbi:hypothetical protein FHX77_000704 [Bifidobacterium commune]|nr:hypothetical protein [Bifidobacterium commune]MBB2955301.1 hypothetical protein [Bifidobacterium commune]
MSSATTPAGGAARNRRSNAGPQLDGTHRTQLRTPPGHYVRASLIITINYQTGTGTGTPPVNTNLGTTDAQGRTIVTLMPDGHSSTAP